MGTTLRKVHASHRVRRSHVSWVSIGFLIDLTLAIALLVAQVHQCLLPPVPPSKLFLKLAVLRARAPSCPVVFSDGHRPYVAVCVTTITSFQCWSQSDTTRCPRSSILAMNGLEISAHRNLDSLTPIWTSEVPKMVHKIQRWFTGPRRHWRLHSLRGTSCRDLIAEWAILSTSSRATRMSSPQLYTPMRVALEPSFVAPTWAMSVVLGHNRPTSPPECVGFFLV